MEVEGDGGRVEGGEGGVQLAISLSLHFFCQKKLFSSSQKLARSKTQTRVMTLTSSGSVGSTKRIVRGGGRPGGRGGRCVRILVGSQ